MKLRHLSLLFVLSFGCKDRSFNAQSDAASLREKLLQPVPARTSRESQEPGSPVGDLLTEGALDYNRKITEMTNIAPYILVPDWTMETRHFAESEDPVIDYRYPGTNNNLGLRFYVAESANRNVAVERMIKSGFLQTGDVVLSYRPEWSNTGPYYHVQMAVSHAGIIIVDGKQIINRDMPLDAVHNGTNFSSQHYRETSFLHVVRPRNLTDDDRARLKVWAEKIGENRAGMVFNSNYGAPRYATDKELRFVAELGEHARGKSSKELLMYCSEFTWSLLALRKCDPATPTLDYKTCVDPLFSPLSFANNEIGLSAGPLINGRAQKFATEEEWDNWLDKVFPATEKEASASIGHRQTASAMKPVFSPLRNYYKAEAQDPNGLQAQSAKKDPYIQAAGTDNYSPAAFLIEAMNQKGSFAYVGTIAFVPQDTYRLATKLNMH